MSNIITVYNTTPIISLSKLSNLEILKALYQKVYIPQKVYYEAIIKDKPGNNELKKAVNDWIEVKNVSDSDLMQSLHNNYGLGKGETSAIVLAKELKADFIFIDDRPARKFAINFFHNELTIVSGTIGILRFATLKGLITKNQFKSKIDFLKENGFYLKDNVYQHILQEINELP